MKRYYVEYYGQPKRSPMSFWVHRFVDTPLWYRSMIFDPPFPPVIPAKGFPYWYVEFDDFTFEFASPEELATCIHVLGQKNLPDTTKETQAHHLGPGTHWLNKLPGRVKSSRYRSKAVRYLRQAQAAFQALSPAAKHEH